MDEGKRAVTRHLSRHMEDIAVGVLPLDIDSDADFESNSSSEDLPHQESVHCTPVNNSPDPVLVDQAPDISLVTVEKSSGRQPGLIAKIKVDRFKLP